MTRRKLNHSHRAIMLLSDVMAAEKAIFLQVCVPSTSHEVVLNFSTYVAIRFVLGDAYTTMSREERQALLHEGVSVTSTLSAYGSFQPFFVVYILKNPQWRLSLPTSQQDSRL